MTVAIDSAVGLDAISLAAREAAATIGALVDVNVGQNRCGVAPGASAVALGTLVAVAPGVTLRGLMGYEGHAVGIADRRERETARARIDAAAPGDETHVRRGGTRRR